MFLVIEDTLWSWLISKMNVDCNLLQTQSPRSYEYKLTTIFNKLEIWSGNGEMDLCNKFILEKKAIFDVFQISREET